MKNPLVSVRLFFNKNPKKKPFWQNAHVRIEHQPQNTPGLMTAELYLPKGGKQTFEPTGRFFTVPAV